MRSSVHRTKKYKSKIDGNITRLQLSRYGKTQKMLFKSTVQEQVAVEQKVKAYMSQHGISSMLTNYYILFGKNMLNPNPTECNIEFNKWAGRNLSWYHLRNIGRMMFNRRLDLRAIDNQPACAMYLPMWEGTGNTAHDVSGNGNNGTLNPGAASVTDETFTSDHDVAVQLDHTNLVALSVVVTDKPPGLTYTEGVDYTIDYNAGTITVLSTGGMADVTDFLIDYDYSDSYPTWAEGLLGQGLYFDGIDDFVEVPDSTGSSLDTISSAFTIITWVKPGDNTAEGDNTIIQKSTPAGADPYRLYGVLMSAGAMKIRFSMSTGAPGTQDTLYSDDTLTQDVWYLVVAQYDGTNMILYLNDVRKTKVFTAGGNIGNNDVSLGLGKDIEKNDKFFTGSIDEVRMFNRCLSAAEIKNIYNAERPAHYPFVE